MQINDNKSLPTTHVGLHNVVWALLYKIKAEQNRVQHRFQTSQKPKPKPTEGIFMRALPFPTELITTDQTQQTPL